MCFALSLAHASNLHLCMMGGALSHLETCAFNIHSIILLYIYIDHYQHPLSGVDHNDLIDN